MKKTKSNLSSPLLKFSKSRSDEKWNSSPREYKLLDEKSVSSCHVLGKNCVSKNITILCVFVLMSLDTFAQRVTISGYIQDVETKEAMIGANVYETHLQKGTSANQYGFYSITLPASDTLSLIFSFTGYKPEAKKITSKSNIRLDIVLTSAGLLDEIEINASRNDDNVNRAQMGVIDVPLRELVNLPALMGERDLMKVIQLLPGVQQAQEGTTGFFVRGGNLDHNLVQLDEAIVYNPNHLFGLVSTFNINAINGVKLIKGGFPAQYGGRLSSILDITMKDGNKEKYQAEGGIGILSSNLTVQGPIIKDKASFIVSARRSYIDLIQKAFIQNNTTLYSIYDVNAKINFELGKNDKLFLSAFKGRDNGNYTGPNSLNYVLGFGNSTATLRWNHLFGSNLFANTSLILNSYDLAVGTTQGNYYSLFYTGIRDVSGKTDFTWTISTKHTLKFGLNYFFHTLFPASYSSAIPMKGNRVKIDPDLIEKRYADEMAIYVNHDWDVADNFSISYGVRVPHFFSYGTTYTEVEPRLMAKVNIDRTSSIKASYTIMNQFIHAVPYISASLPTDVWLSSSQKVKPQNSEQYSFGVFKNFNDNLIEASVEVYHKEMKNQVLFKQGTQLTLETNMEEQLTFGKGTSYGAEFFIKKNSGRLAGWFSYTWSKTTQTFPEINFGNPFPFTYDRRHNLAIVGTYEINKRWSVGADFVFRTGSALTIPPGRIPVSDGTLYDGWYYDYSGRNNTRMKSYHRLDVSFSNKKEKKFRGRKYQREWVFGAYNIYNRKNPYFVYLTVDSTQQPKAKQVSLLPIIPSITYNFKF